MSAEDMSSLDLTSYMSLADMPEDPGFSTYFWHNFKKAAFTDVAFIVQTSYGDSMIPATKLPLALFSPYFADLFYGQGRDPNEKRRVHIKNVNLEAFHAMLKHMNGNTPNITSIQQACDLHKVASKFKVESLINLCHDFLRDIPIEPINVFIMLGMGRKMQNKSVTDRCLMFLQERTSEVIKSYDLHDVTKSMVYEILELKELSLACEYELARWLFDWAAVKYRDDDSRCSSTREYLEKLLQEINFLALTHEEFAKLCFDHEGFFTDAEEASIFRNIGLRDSRPMPDWYDRDVAFRRYTGSRYLDADDAD